MTPDTPRVDPLPAPVRGRSFGSALPTETVDLVQGGTMRTEYRGVPFFKSPFDISLYLQLLGRLLPGTVIEIGTKFGGSALWFADMLTAHGVDSPRVLSIDNQPLSRVQDKRIDFITGDANALDEALPDRVLAACPRPFLVIEDSSHMYRETTAVLEFFHPVLEPGDYLVVEDGVVGQLSGEPYRRYDNGPSRALTDFLVAHDEHYEIDTALCDQFGHNVTWNPNGWLRRR